jgi:hypothetical protein
MDIILLIVALELLSVSLVLIYTSWFWRFTILVMSIIYYGVKYIDGDEYTGNRSWQILRNRTLFGKSVEHLIGNPEIFNVKNQQMLFIVIGNLTNMGLVHGFGFHGGKIKMRGLVYTLPDILFKVPLLRDVLLWSGAVSGSSESNLLELMSKGKSVVYCPAGMMDSKASAPSNAVFEFAHTNRITVVPVLITGERKRYQIASWPQLQSWSYERFKWPFPFFFFPRIFDKKKRPPEIRVIIGSQMEGARHGDPEAFKNLFMGHFTNLLGKEEV